MLSGVSPADTISSFGSLAALSHAPSLRKKYRRGGFGVVVAYYLISIAYLIVRGPKIGSNNPGVELSKPFRANPKQREGNRDKCSEQKTYQVQVYQYTKPMYSYVYTMQIMILLVRGWCQLRNNTLCNWNGKSRERNIGGKKKTTLVHRALQQHANAINLLTGTPPGPSPSSRPAP